MATREDILLRVLTDVQQSLAEFNKLRTEGTRSLQSLNKEAASSGEALQKAYTSAAQGAARVLKDLLSVVGRLGSANATQLEAVRAATRKALDAYALLGKDAPKYIQKIASSLDVLETASEKQTRGAKQRIDEFTASLRQAASDSATSVRALVGSIGNLANANATQLGKIKSAVQTALDAYALLGTKPPQDIAKVATALNVLSSVEAKQARESQKLADQQAKAAQRLAAEQEKSAARRAAAEEKAAARQKASADNVADSFRRLRTVLGTLGVAFGTRQLLQFGKEAVNTTVRLEALQAQLAAAAGGAREGAEAYEFATFQADRLGQSYFVIGEGLARFEAATRTSNLSLAARRDVFLATIEASRVLNLTEQRLSNSLLALEQIASKGTVSMEELRRQLGDNIPGAVQILARELGVTIPELFRMIEANELLAEVALPALADGFRKAFGEGLPAALETAATKLGQFNNLLIRTRESFATGFIDEFLDALNKVSEAEDTVAGSARVMGEVVGKALAGIVEELRPLGLIIAQLEAIGDVKQEVTKGFEEIRADVRGFGDDVEGSGLSVETFNEAMRRATGEFGEFIDRTSQSGRETKQFAEEISSAASEIDKLLESGLKSGATKAFTDLINLFSLLQSSGKATEEQYQKLLEKADAAILIIGEGNPRILAARDAMAAAAGEVLKYADNLEKIEEAQEGVVDSLVLGTEAFEKWREKAVKSAEDAEREFHNFVTVIGGLEGATEEHLSKAAELYTKAKDAAAEYGGDVSLALLDASAALRDHIGVLGDLRKEAREAVDEARQLIASIGDLSAANLTQTELVKDALQEVLDAYEAIGQQVPEDLQQVISALGVLSSTQEDQLKELEKLAKEEERILKDRIRNYERLIDTLIKVQDQLSPDSSKDRLVESLAEAQAELEAIQDQTILSDEDIARADELRDQIITLKDEVNKFDEGLDEASASLSEVDSAIRDLVLSNRDAFRDLDEASRAAIENLLGRLQSSAIQGTASGEFIRNIFRQVSDVLQQAGVDTIELESALAEARGEGVNLQRLFESLGKTQEEQTKKQKDTIESLKEQQTEYEKLRKEIDRVEAAKRTLLDTTHRVTVELVEQVRLCGELARCIGGR